MDAVQRRPFPLLVGDTSFEFYNVIGAPVGEWHTVGARKVYGTHKVINEPIERVNIEKFR